MNEVLKHKTVGLEIKNNCVSIKRVELVKKDNLYTVVERQIDDVIKITYHQPFTDSLMIPLKSINLPEKGRFLIEYIYSDELIADIKFNQYAEIDWDIEQEYLHHYFN